MKYKLNKYLALHNIASRRKADDLIKNGEVYINEREAVLGETVNSKLDTIRVKKVTILPNEKVYYEYYFLNKPKEVLASVGDNRGRKSVTDLIKSKNMLFPVGRLDFNSTGLMILTNDGDFTNIITHPKNHLPKVYEVLTVEKINKKHLKIIERGGLIINNKKTSKTEIKIINDYKFQITLYEGIKRQIRESCKLVGLHVKDLKRIQIGPFKLDTLKLGEYSPFTQAELKKVNTIKLEGYR
jgi:23S rRNA pseudouridine2605 synthase